MRSTVLPLAGCSKAIIMALLIVGCGQTEKGASHRSTLTASDSDQTATKRPMQVDSPLVTVNLTANGQDGRVYVTPGSSVELAWTSEGAAFCSGPANAIGPKGTLKSAPIVEAVAFSISCMGGDGTASDTVKVIPGEAPTNGTDPTTPVVTEVTSFETAGTDDIKYCKAGSADLLTDIAYPKNGVGPFPGIIFVHGGAWTSGTRKTFTDGIKEAASQGFVAMTIDYRMTGALFPGQVEDVKCAVRWLRANAVTYKLRKEKIALFGVSAGAQLAMLAAYSDPSLFQGTGGSAGSTSTVQAVVDWSGPADLTTLYPTLSIGDQTAMSAALGGSPAQKPEVYAAASPITHVSAGDPPTWITHGETDNLVPLSQSVALNNAIKKVGASNLKTLPGEGHVFGPATAKTAFNDAMVFLTIQLKP